MALETVSQVWGVLGFLVSPAKKALLATLPDERKSGLLETVRNFLTSEPKQIDNRVKNIQEESWRSALDYYKDVVIFLKNKFLDAEPTQQAREELKRKLALAEAKAIEAMNIGNKLEKNSGGFPLIDAIYIRVFCVMLIELLGTEPNNIGASVKFIVETWKDDVHSKLYNRSSVQQCLNNNLNPGVVQNLLPLNQKKEAFEQMKSLLSVMLKWTIDLARAVQDKPELLALIAEFVENIDVMEGMRECDRFLREQVIDTLNAHPLCCTRAKPVDPIGVLITGFDMKFNHSEGSDAKIKLYSLASHSTRKLDIRLIEGRHRHVSGGVLRDGRVMVTGGKTRFHASLSSSELIDLESYEVTPGPPLKQARFDAASVMLNGDFYVSGGMDKEQYCLSSCEVFRDGNWMSTSDMKVARNHHSMVAVDKYIYAIGGELENQKPLDSVERYCPETNTWKTMAHSIHKRSGLGAAELNGCIYLCGGRGGVNNDLGQISSCERYDPITNRWQRMADMNHARQVFHLVSVGANLYALDHTSECYDVRENKWVVVGEYRERGFGASQVVVPYC